MQFIPKIKLKTRSSPPWVDGEVINLGKRVMKPLERRLIAEILRKPGLSTADSEIAYEHLPTQNI